MIGLVPRTVAFVVVLAHDRNDHFGLPIMPRDALVRHYAFAVPSPGDLTWLVWRLADRGVVEIGAGTGYWAWMLSQYGVDVLAYDTDAWTTRGTLSSHRFHPVRRGGCERAADHPDRALLLCWPEMDTTMASDALAAYTGDLLIYVGGNLTADDEFRRTLRERWDLVDFSDHHVSWSGMGSDVGFFRRADGLSRRRRLLQRHPELAVLLPDFGVGAPQGMLDVFEANAESLVDEIRQWRQGG